jgi:SHS2 domain-containing protein
MPLYTPYEVFAMPYEYLDHQADLGIRGIGVTPEEAFDQGAQAMLEAMSNTQLIRPRQQFEQRCRAIDVPSLFVEWLNELLYQREVNDVLFCSARVLRIDRQGDEWTLEGLAMGESLDPDRHEVHTEVKAATYSGLDYVASDRLYIVQCVVDL